MHHHLLKNPVGTKPSCKHLQMTYLDWLVHLKTCFYHQPPWPPAQQKERVVQCCHRRRVVPSWIHSPSCLLTKRHRPLRDGLGRLPNLFPDFASPRFGDPTLMEYGSARMIPNNKISPNKNRHSNGGSMDNKINKHRPGSPLSPKQPRSAEKNKKDSASSGKKSKKSDTTLKPGDIKVENSVLMEEHGKMLDLRDLKVEPGRDDPRKTGGSTADLRPDQHRHHHHQQQLHHLPHQTVDARAVKFEKPKCILKSPKVSCFISHYFIAIDKACMFVLHGLNSITVVILYVSLIT